MLELRIWFFQNKNFPCWRNFVFPRARNDIIFLEDSFKDSLIVPSLTVLLVSCHLFDYSSCNLHIPSLLQRHFSTSDLVITRTHRTARFLPPPRLLQLQLGHPFTASASSASIQRDFIATTTDSIHLITKPINSNTLENT